MLYIALNVSGNTLYIEKAPKSLGTKTKALSLIGLPD